MSEISLPRIDVPEAYEVRGVAHYGRLIEGVDFLVKRANYTEDQNAQMRTEAGFLGVDPFMQPNRFVQAHNDLLNEMQADLTEQLPKVKNEVVTRTATHFSDGDQSTEKALAGLLSTRLLATEQVIVADSLNYQHNIAGSFNGVARQPVVVSSELILQMGKSNDLAEFHDRVGKVILAHEIMHGMSTAGIQDMWLIDGYPIRSGLHVSLFEHPLDYDKVEKTVYAEWLNEATIESFRQSIMGTRDIRYEPHVMVLRMLDELAPGLGDRLMLASLDASGPAPIFAEIEELLGPTAIDDVAQLLTQVQKRSQLPWLKDEVTTMLPKNLRLEGRSIIDRKQREIFSDK